MTLTACSHLPAISPIPAPEYEVGWFKVDLYDDHGNITGEAACLIPNDFGENYLFFLNVEDVIGIEGLD